MKTPIQIHERIQALQLRAKDGIDLSFEIEALKYCIQNNNLYIIKEQLLDQIVEMKYK